MKKKLTLPALRLPRIGSPARLGVLLIGTLLSGLIVYLVINFVSLVWESKQQDRQIAEGQAALERQEQLNQQLKDELGYAESDAYVERAARERLGMAREGETVLIPEFTVPTSLAVPQGQPEPTPRARSSVPNWRRWLGALSGSP